MNAFLFVQVLLLDSQIMKPGPVFRLVLEVISTLLLKILLENVSEIVQMEPLNKIQQEVASQIVMRVLLTHNQGTVLQLVLNILMAIFQQEFVLIFVQNSHLSYTQKTTLTCANLPAKQNTTLLPMIQQIDVFHFVQSVRAYLQILKQDSVYLSVFNLP